MLVITRKTGEQVIIGDNICVTVLEIRGRQAKIGIEAPDSVHIVRAELTGRQPKASPLEDSSELTHNEDCESSSVLLSVNS